MAAFGDEDDFVFKEKKKAERESGDTAAQLLPVKQLRNPNMSLKCLCCALSAGEYQDSEHAKVNLKGRRSCWNGERESNNICSRSAVRVVVVVGGYGGCTVLR